MSHGDGSEAQFCFCFPAKVLKDALDEDGQDSAQQGGIVGQDVPERMREAQDPLTDRRVAEYVVRQIRRTIIHSSSDA